MEEHIVDGVCAHVIQLDQQMTCCCMCGVIIHTTMDEGFLFNGCSGFATTPIELCSPPIKPARRRKLVHVTLTQHHSSSTAATRKSLVTKTKSTSRRCYSSPVAEAMPVSPVSFTYEDDIKKLGFETETVSHAFTLLNSLPVELKGPLRTHMLGACLFLSAKTYGPMDIDDVGMRLGCSRKSITRSLKRLHLDFNIRNVNLDIYQTLDLIEPRIIRDKIDKKVLIDLIRRLGPENSVLIKSRPINTVAGLIMHAFALDISPEFGLSASTTNKIASNIARALGIN